MNASARIETTMLPTAPGLLFKHIHWPEIEAMGGGALALGALRGRWLRTRPGTAAGSAGSPAE